MTAPLTKLAQLKKVHKPKRKRCKLKSCNKLFVPGRAMQPCCSFAHEFEYATSNIDELVKDGAKLREKEIKEKKKAFKINDTKNLIEIAQNTVNKYIKLRDKNEPCISCKTFNAKWDSGHYESVGGNKQLRFNTLNIHKQCYYCNCHLSANLQPYRINLINKIGLEKVERLEQDHSIKKYDVEYLTKLIKIFRKKIKLYERLFR
jgi:hypothetical protein